MIRRQERRAEVWFRDEDVGWRGMRAEARDGREGRGSAGYSQNPEV